METERDINSISSPHSQIQTNSSQEITKQNLINEPQFQGMCNFINNSLPLQQMDFGMDQHTSQNPNKLLGNEIQQPPISISDYADLRMNQNYAFVDKTLLIKDIINGPDTSIMIIRPRRWGKSLNLSMCYYYLSNTQSHTYQDLFGGTMIDQPENKSFKEQHSNKYPVLYIDFNKFPNTSESKDWPYNGFSTIFATVFQDYEDVISRSEEISFELRQKIIKSFYESTVNIQDIILSLTRALKKIYQKKCIVLIDEYDRPIHDKLDDNENLLRLKAPYEDFLRAGLKNNRDLYKAVLTGCARVAMTDLFSGMNNFHSYTMLDIAHSQYYGFNEKEAFAIVQRISGGNMSFDEKEAIRRYYNGYKIQVKGGYENLYNPYSIIHYAENRVIKDYWSQTSQNKLLEKAFFLITAEVRNKLNFLIGGGVIELEITEKFSLDELKDVRKIWALLFFGGYLTFVEKADNNYYWVKIPNQEARSCLIQFDERLTLKFEDIDEHRIRKAFETNEFTPFEEEYNKQIQTRLAQELMSGRTLANEASYHSLLYWNLARILRSWKDVASERYNGFGYFDIFVISKEKSGDQRAHIMELKFLSINDGKSDEKRQAKIKEAETQIRDRKYVDYLKKPKYSHIKEVYTFCVLCCSCSINFYYFDKVSINL